MSTKPADPTLDHGVLLAGVADLDPPRMVTRFDVAARQTWTDVKAHEYEDTPRTLRIKVRALADLIRRSAHCVAYTGAGISTAAGIDDYATKAKKDSVTAAGRPVIKDWKNALPTRTHYVLAAMHRAGLLPHWIQQNHDSLPQKAGFPQHCLNEIHGSLHDIANPIVPYEGTLRDDLFQWMQEETDRADLCLALGTSMSGFTCDMVPETVATKYLKQGAGLGLVIVNLQRTTNDHLAALRIFSKTDDVFAMLAEELGLPAHEVEGRMLYTPDVPAEHCDAGVDDVFLVPFDSKTGEPTDDPDRMMWWDLRIGARLRLTGGPYKGDIGEVIAKNAAGDYRIRFANSYNKVFNVRRRTFSLWLGSWWVEAATRGRGIVPGGKCPFVWLEPACAKPDRASSIGSEIKSKAVYERMRKVGMPVEVIRHKMQANGCPIDLISEVLGNNQ